MQQLTTGIFLPEECCIKRPINWRILIVRREKNGINYSHSVHMTIQVSLYNNTDRSADDNQFN